MSALITSHQGGYTQTPLRLLPRRLHGTAQKLNTQPRSRSPLVQLERIRKSFDGKDVISDLNLTINDGEFLTLLGPSGCGKTTVLRLIAGLENVDNGHIHLENQDITQVPAEEPPRQYRLSELCPVPAHDRV
jgi:ABC-type bacteriocin/lantibiotic exporter with double-glycine peptidase domain